MNHFWTFYVIFLNNFKYFLEIYSLSNITWNVLNWFHLQTTRKSCRQPEMSGWIQATMQLNTIVTMLHRVSYLYSSLTQWVPKYVYLSFPLGKYNVPKIAVSQYTISTIHLSLVCLSTHLTCNTTAEKNVSYQAVTNILEAI